MTRDDSSRRVAAQRVADALGDLFDGVSPSNRAAAEEELRDAGVDPAGVARRIAATAANGFPARDRRGERTHGAAQRQGGASRERATTAASREYRGARLHRTRVLGGAAALLLIGIAIGWFLGHGGLRSPDAPMEMARNHPLTTLDERRAVVAENVPEGGDARPQPGGEEVTGPSDANARQAEAARERETDEAAGAAPLHSAPRGETSNPSTGDAAAEPHSDAAVEGEPSTVADAESSGQWILDASNWERGTAILPAPIVERVKAGDYWFAVQPIAPAVLAEGYSERFQDQSAQNAGLYEVDPTSCALREVDSGQTPSFYFGFPFSGLRQNDRSAGCKIMWNAAAASAVGGGQVARFVSHQFADGSRSPDRRLELTFSFTPFLGSDSGRLANPQMLRSASMMQLNAPPELTGTAVLTRRKIDPGARDDVWMYHSSLRRVRHLSPAQLSDSLFGSDISPDKFDCFDGKLEDFTWRLVGRQTVLVPTVGVESSIQSAVSQRVTVPMPSLRAAFEVKGSRGAPWLVVDNLTMSERPVWIVEGVPRAIQYAVGKMVLYVDRDLFRTYWRLDYSRHGEYLGHTMCAQHWFRTVDGLATATAGALFAVTDPISHATLSRATEQSFTQERGDDFFTIQTMVETAR